MCAAPGGLPPIPSGGSPVHRLGKVSVRVNVRLRNVRSNLRSFLTVAASVSQLEVFHVAWMSAFCNRYNVIDCSTPRMWTLERLVDRLSADSTDVSRCQYDLPICLVLGAEGSCHFFTHISPLPPSPCSPCGSRGERILFFLHLFCITMPHDIAGGGDVEHRYGES